MLDHRARSSTIFRQYQQLKSSWQRMPRLHILRIVGVAICLLVIFLVILGSAWKPEALAPLSLAHPTPIDNIHPVLKLITAARNEFSIRSEQQSKSFSEAVKNYRKRYGISPPPYFDRWYEYVEKNNIPLRDEYDDIFECLKPFWGVSPAFIRERVATAIATNDFITGVSIRGGKVNVTELGEDWDGISRAVTPFAAFFPDMDIAFNRHDEPRTIIPYDHLNQLLKRANQHHAAHSVKTSTWSPRPLDLDSKPEDKILRSPFVGSTHPFTWPIATVSCPPDSPARELSFEGTNYPDSSKAYTSSPLNFMQNRTAATDICNQPTLKDVHSLFNSPNAWSITHDPIPIFSTSKPSTFHDILFPAPRYLTDANHRNPAKDWLWEDKVDNLHWRGATTSGYSDHGVWHIQNRQRFVESVEKPGQGFVLHNDNRNGWTPREAERQQGVYRDFFDVHFWAVDNCVEEDCKAQKEYFQLQDVEPLDDNWKHKFLLDIDGNAVSGMFPAFLGSRSLVLKQALFREWYEDRIVPWVHYIPLGFNGSDHLEIMRFLNHEEAGRKVAKEIAQESQMWAQKTLEQVDMRAWVFRLLLEYSRLIDDNRDELGFIH